MAHDDEETERLIPIKDEHKNSECRGFWCQLIFSLFGVIFLCTGIIMADLWSQIFGDIMKNKLELKNNTQTYQYWQQIPAPLHLSVYLFNWTNPEETLKEKAKPILQQLGPYVFKENRTKVNITFNSNNTVTYMQLKNWQFDPSLSNGSLSDQVTTINIVLTILDEYLQDIKAHWLITIIIDYLLIGKNIKNPYVTKTAGEFIFDGYDDPLLDLLLKYKSYLSTDIPFKRVGWFYGMNMSTSADGKINMFTGLNDIEKVGMVHSVNFTEKLNVFNKDCSFSSASAGDLWPEHTAKQPNISIYIPKICSAITMTNKMSTYIINEIKGVEFAAESDVFNNKCYNSSSEQLSPGVRSLKYCGNSPNTPPLYISFPHFYLADSWYRKSIRGMNPNQNLHEFKIILENEYSIPLEVAARLQFNVKIKPSEKITIMKNLPKVFLPLFWFSENFEIPRNISDELWIATNVLPNATPYMWLIITTLGFLMLIIPIYGYTRKINRIPS